jgi:hypothetical protein
VLGLAAVALGVAGCGGHERRAEPHLLRSDARQLVALAQHVARDAPSDGCAAQQEIAALSAQAHSLVAAGRVPARLRAPLLAGVAAVAADAPACTPPAPAAVPAPAPVEQPGNGKGKAKGHFGDEDHGNGKGHGHDDEG